MSSEIRCWRKVQSRIFFFDLKVFLLLFKCLSSIVSMRIGRLLMALEIDQVAQVVKRVAICLGRKGFSLV